MFQSERRFCYENYKDYLKEGRIFTVLDSKGKSRLVSLALLPQKENADVENRKWGHGKMRLTLIVTKLTGNA